MLILIVIYHLHCLLYHFTTTAWFNCI